MRPDNRDLLKKPLIIPFFVVHEGCPHRCIFCNQPVTVRHYPLRLTRESMEKGIHDYLAWNKGKTKGVELAFYGGNFTGIDIDYQEQLLSWAQFYVRQGSVHSIRISTRPDYIDQNKTNLLRKYGVKTVEIGAQSFVAEVLKKRKEVTAFLIRRKQS